MLSRPVLADTFTVETHSLQMTLVTSISNGSPGCIYNYTVGNTYELYPRRLLQVMNVNKWNPSEIRGFQVRILAGSFLPHGMYIIP